MNEVSRKENRDCFPIAALVIGILCCAPCGCISPGVMKLAKPQAKPSQEEFSCGEKCPPSLRSLPLTDKPH